MKLVITEKPSVSRTVAAVLGASYNRKGYYEGSGWIIAWCFGHLAGLADAAAYDPAYLKWRREDLPIFPEPSGFTNTAEEKARMPAVPRLIPSLVYQGKLRQIGRAHV